MCDSDTTDMEVCLFHAMRGHKPVGVNRFFQMLFIQEKLNNSSHKRMSSKQIWTHLGTMYDLQALNESEILPFPNKEGEFSLPNDIISLSTKDTKSEEDSQADGKDIKTPKEKSDKSEAKPEPKHTPSIVNEKLLENTPKRKRTRHTHSAQSSPATTPEVPNKRRR